MSELPFWRPMWTLSVREVVLFLRQRSRIAGALGVPLVFWLLSGSIFGGSIHLSGVEDSKNYLLYTFPAVIGAVLLFTAIFSCNSIIDDRRTGFLQGVLVSPARRSAVVLGKVVGTTAIAVGQALLFLALAPAIGISMGLAAVMASIAAMCLVGFAVTGLGFWLAWRMESTQGFHAIMNLLLLPMLLLSGAFAPPQDSWTWVRWVTTINPMTYAMTLLRTAVQYGTDRNDALAGGGSPAVALAVTVFFAGLMFAASVRVATDARARIAT